MRSGGSPLQIHHRPDRGRAGAGAVVRARAASGGRRHHRRIRDDAERDDSPRRRTDRRPHLREPGRGGGALRLLASVIEVPGGVSIKGGRPTQAGVQIGASTLTDPVLGLVHFTLPDDAIDSVAVMPNPYAVEYGRFSSGLVVIQTRRGGDTWKTRLNNLDPTFRLGRSGQPFDIKGIGAFGPRLETGGPLLKDRLFLEQTAQFRYSASDVPSRPEDELRTTKWFSSFTRVDANLAPRHSLVATGGFFSGVTSQATLRTLTPPRAPGGV